VNRYSFVTGAILAAVGVSGAAATDLGSSSFSAGVALLLPENTGFLYSAQVDAQGLGTGASSISAENANFTLTGYASTTGSDILAPVDPENALTTAGSGIYADFNFDRTVATNATSSGQGKVVATGEAIGSIGGVGSASGSSSQQSIIGDVVTNSTSDSESAASLIGGSRTSLVAGVLGTTGTFVGDTGTSVTDSQSGIALAGVATKGDGGTTVEIVAIDGTPVVGDINVASGTGIAGITGEWGSPSLNLSVLNAGGGTVSLGVETGGFFTGGVSTLGHSTFSQATQAP
jgi:hypothetical protein